MAAEPIRPLKRRETVQATIVDVLTTCRSTAELTAWCIEVADWMDTITPSTADPMQDSRVQDLERQLEAFQLAASQGATAQAARIVSLEGELAAATQLLEQEPDDEDIDAADQIAQLRLRIEALEEAFAGACTARDEAQSRLSMCESLVVPLLGLKAHAAQYLDDRGFAHDGSPQQIAVQLNSEAIRR